VFSSHHFSFGLSGLDLVRDSNGGTSLRPADPHTMKTISLIETNRSGRKMRIILKITAIRAIAVLVGLIV
jgi:hypothetical protein